MKKIILMATLVSAPVLADDFDGFLVEVDRLNITEENLTELQSVSLDHLGIYKVDQLNNELTSKTWVKRIEPNYNISIDSTDPLFETSWGLENLGNNEPRRGGGRFPVPGKLGADSNIFPAWTITRGSSDIKIAVIDTGIDYNHPDLKDNMWVNEVELNGKAGIDDDGNGYIDDIHGFNFSNNSSDPMDDNKHGTHVAGIIGASHNQIGLAGVMGKVQLIAVKFMDNKGRGNAAGAIAAIEYAVKNGAQVLNNSWGMLNKSELLKEAFERAQQANVLSVVAAGNSYLNNDVNPRYPASFDLDGVITVAAYNAEDRLAAFSCFGPNSVDLAAPGRNIVSTIPGGEYAVLSGTSMAAPYVTGAIGLYLSVNPESSYIKIKENLLNTVQYMEHLKGRVLSEGRMDIGKFLKN